MNRPPAFQFYAADFLADENVSTMSNQQVGCYIKLLCYCWREGSIPEDISKIAKLCGEDGSAMAQLWNGISGCFAASIAEPSRLVNSRLERERIKQAERRKERSISGTKGAKCRWNKKLLSNGSAIDQPMAKNGSSTSSSLVPQEAVALAERLRFLILQNKPNSKMTDSQVKNWGKEADKMFRLDGRSPTSALELLEWCQHDPFWSSNILSVASFRKHYDQLEIKRRNGNGRKRSGIEFFSEYETAGEQLADRRDPK